MRGHVDYELSSKAQNLIVFDPGGAFAHAAWSDQAHGFAIFKNVDDRLTATGM